MTSLPEKKLQSPLGLEPAAGLVLDEDSQEFLTSPFRAKFMTQFLLGSNKLEFYGQLFTMAKYSKFFKENISTFGTDNPPYSLLTNGAVLERPMTLLWLEINGYPNQASPNLASLSMTELLHMYRLCGYFFVIEEVYIDQIMIQSIIRFIRGDKDDVKEALKISVNQGTLITMLNTLFKNLIDLSLDPQELRNFTQVFLTKEQLEEDKSNWRNFVEERLKVVTANIFNRLAEYPEISKSLNYIPVYARDTLVTFAERKALANPNSLGSGNEEYGWEYELKDGKPSFRIGAPGEMYRVAYPVVWGPDKIQFDFELVPIAQAGGIINTGLNTRNIGSANDFVMYPITVS